MSMRTCFLRLAPLLLLAILAPLAPADEGETDKAKAAAAAQARAYERERLVRMARRAVGRRGSAQDPFVAMQQALAADLAYAHGYEPKDAEERALLAEFEKTVEERIRLVGWPGEEGGTPALDGALQEARRLDDWLAGLATCDVVISDVGTEPADGRPYHWPPELEKPKEEPTPVPADEGAVEAAPPGPPPPAEGEAPAPVDEPAGTPSEPAAPEPEEEAEPEKKPEPAPKPTKPPTFKELEAWAQFVIEKHESGSLLGKVVTAQVCGVADRLLGAARQPPAYVHPDVQRLHRHAVVSEDVFAYNAPYAALRLQQAEEREQYMQHDQPPASLVDEAMVRSKAAQVATYTAGFAARKKQYEQVVQSLDRMVEDLDAWKTQAALLAQEIEERQRALAPPKDEKPEGEQGDESDSDGDEEAAAPVEPPPAPLALRLAEARESLASLDITLLYMTAVRADDRMALLRRLMNASEAEAQSAEQAHTRYAAALLKLRGARRLDRLYGDEHRLRLWVSRLEETEPAEGSVRGRRLDAYRASLALLEVVRDSVVRQRQLTPGGTEDEDDDDEEEAVAQAPTGTSAEKSKPGNATEEVKLPSILLAPERATWDVKYVELATRALEAPKLGRAFDARLIARHYAAVNDRIGALLVARNRATEEASLRKLYDAAYATAEAAIAKLSPSDVAVRTHRLPNLLRVAGEDFEAAMSGIHEQGDRNRQRLDALLDYRALLGNQGTRSLLIRTDPDLADNDIRRAFDDTSAAVTQATRWLTLEDDEHALHFLASSWWRLLALLVLVVVAVYGVWFLRRRIDAWIEKQAAANPLLRHAGASIREESAEAKRRRAEGDTVVEVTAEDILQAEADEAEDEPQGETDAEREVRKAHEIQPPTTKPDADADAKPAGAEGGAR